MSKLSLRLNIRGKLGLFAVIVAALFAVIVYWLVIPLVEQEKLIERKATLHAVVQSATSLMQYYEDGIRTYQWKTDPDFPHSRTEAQARVLTHLRQVRFGEDEHLFIMDGTGQMVMHPLKPELEGRNMSDVKAPDGSLPFKQMVILAQRDELTYVSHTWLSKWSRSVYEPQTTCAEYFYPWDWVVCSSLYTQDIQDAIFELTVRTTGYIIAGSLAGLVILYLIAHLITRPVVQLDRQVRNIRDDTTGDVSDIITVSGNDEIGNLADAFRYTLTSLQRTMVQLKEKEEDLRTTLNSIGDAVIATDTSGNVTRLNPVAEKLTGWKQEEARNRPLTDVFHIVNAQTSKPAANPVNRVLSDGETVGLANHTKLISRNGCEYQIADSAAPIMNVDGSIAGVVLVFRDVTEDYRIHKELRENEERLSLALDVSGAGIWRWHVTKGEVSFDDRFHRMLGYSEGELPGTAEAWRSFHHPDDLDEVMNRFESHARGQTPIYESVHRLRRHNGEWLWVMTRGRIISRNSHHQPEHCIGVAIDITDRKQGEEAKLNFERQVQHAQKLESLGVLAGGIAHDFNNLLMAILGNADLAMNELPPSSPVHRNLAEIEKASKRAADLAKQMLAYSGKGQFVIDQIDLGRLVEEMVHLLQVSISKKAELKFNFAPNLPCIDGDATQIRQVIMNLITNASESLGDDNGVITLSTDVIFCDDAYLSGINGSVRIGSEEPLPEGRYVFLEVSDTGCGMDNSTVERIFDPFFTTKFTGRGLGMSATLGIIRGHRGAIKVYSEPDKGTTFKILFPVSESTIDSSRSPINSETSPSTLGMHGTVLVADDDETVCSISRQMLEKLGFDVITASNGMEAVGCYREHQEDILCILLDLTMPHMNGEEAFREIFHINRNARVILCSGYNEQDATERFSGKGLAGFLQKPYTLAALREKLHKILT